jgi:hypothetical protein
MAKITFDKQEIEDIRKIARAEAEDVLNGRVSSKGAPCRGDIWTKEDDQRLRDDFFAFIMQAAVDRGRSVNSIVARLRKLEVSDI